MPASRIKELQQYGFGVAYFPSALQWQEEAEDVNVFEEMAAMLSTPQHVWEYTGPDLSDAADRLIAILDEWSEDMGASYEDAVNLSQALVVRARDPYGAFYEEVLETDELARIAAKVERDVEKQGISPFGPLSKEGRVVHDDRTIYPKLWKKGFRSAVVSEGEKRAPAPETEWEKMGREAVRQSLYLDDGDPRPRLRRRIRRRRSGPGRGWWRQPREHAAAARKGWSRRRR